MRVHILTHKFEKQNMVTIYRGGKNYDKLKCSVCGLEGVRYGLSDWVLVKKDKKCLLSKSKTVRVISSDACWQFGFLPDKDYEVMPCPEEYREKYGKDLWIYSEERNEPVRLLPGEFIFSDILNNNI